jgi:hypothetical protein
MRKWQAVTSLAIQNQTGLSSVVCKVLPLLQIWKESNMRILMQHNMKIMDMQDKTKHA